MAELALSSKPDENAGHPLAAALYTVSLFHCMTVRCRSTGKESGSPGATIGSAPRSRTPGSACRAAHARPRSAQRVLRGGACVTHGALWYFTGDPDTLVQEYERVLAEIPADTMSLHACMRVEYRHRCVRHVPDTRSL